MVMICIFHNRIIKVQWVEGELNRNGKIPLESFQFLMSQPLLTLRQLWPLRKFIFRAKL